MQIVHITTIDEGGAYKAVKRVNQCMNRIGIDSSILLRNKICSSNIGEVYLNNFVKKMISKLKNGINHVLGKTPFDRSLLGSDVSNEECVKKADIVMIHWINSFLSISSLRKLLNLDKNVFIVLHDTWFFTGGCHINLDCMQFMNGCGNCPILNSKKNKDISYVNFKEKENLFKNIHTHIIGPSHDIINKASLSLILENQSFQVIPNPIDLKVFCPRNNEADRIDLGIATCKKVILFGASYNGILNKAKGFTFLIEALKRLNNEFFLLIFGNAEDKNLKNVQQEYKLLGYIEDEEDMAKIYSLADVYVNPSLQESFGYTTLESLACGTPVVSFPNGGSSDLIVHRENGYLAEYKNVDSLVDGILYCTDENNVDALFNASINKAKQFSYENIGKIYNELFNHLLNNK